MTKTFFNLGSINIDHVYAVDHFVRPGETLSSHSYQQHAGGKGFNQSIALARAGATVKHLGKVDKKTENYLSVLAQAGIDITNIHQSQLPTGHAIIQVTPNGDNSIVLFPGANLDIGDSEVQRALAQAQPGDVFLCQNETSGLAMALTAAHEKACI